MIKIPLNEGWKFRRIEGKSIADVRMEIGNSHIHNYGKNPVTRVDTVDTGNSSQSGKQNSGLTENNTDNEESITDINTDNVKSIVDIVAANDEEVIDLPHSFYSNDDQYRGLAVYEKEVAVEPGWRDGKKFLFIDIPAADQHAMVYADDTFLTEHKGGYSAFRAEVPCDCLKKQSFLLRIFLTNEKNDVISPLAGDFTIYGGLYRGVNLLVTEKSHFDYMYYGTNGIIARTEMQDGDGVIFVEPHTVASENVKIRYSVSLWHRIHDNIDSIQGSNSVDESYGIKKEPASSKKNLSDVTKQYIGQGDDCTNSGQNFDSVNKKSTAKDLEVLCEEHGIGNKVQILIKTPLLWDGRGNVNLYALKAELIDDGRVVDSVTVRLGFRSFRMDSERGFYLNGRPVRINGVAKHQDTAEIYNAVKDEDINRDFELIDEIGANAVRLSHYQHPQHTYDLCDEKGYIVWAEIPMLKMPDSGEVFENAEQQLKELILQNIHHPGIFFWGIQNEIGMFRDAAFMHEELRKMRDMAKELDPSRLVTSANLYTVKFRSELNNVTDMIGYNVYFGWYYGEMQDYDKYLDRFHEERPDMPLGMSEYGVDANVLLHSEEPKVRDYSEEYQALYHETVYPIFESKSYLWGSFVWNMFDFGSALRKEGGTENRNQKGLVTFDRKIKKDAFYYYKSRWSKEPFVHICSKRFKNRAKDEINIKVYTNVPEVILEINGKKTAEGINSENGVVVFREVHLNNGENIIRVTGGTCSDECMFLRVSEEDSSYTLPDSGAGQAVKNWFLTGDSVVREGYYSIEDTANDLLENRTTRDVLEVFMPGLVKMMTEKDIIPLGLSLKSILSRNSGDIDQKALNTELNKIPVEY